MEPFWGSSGPVSLAGLLLLLQLAGIYFWRSLLWVAEPLTEANLGSIAKLQLCATPAQVATCLNRWRDSLRIPRHRIVRPMECRPPVCETSCATHCGET
jgi:hypothetical protein